MIVQACWLYPGYDKNDEMCAYLLDLASQRNGMAPQLQVDNADTSHIDIPECLRHRCTNMLEPLRMHIKYGKCSVAQTPKMLSFE